MNIVCEPLGPVEANCYLLMQDGNALAVDPGDDWPELDEILAKNGCTLKAILLTHAHFDHIGGVENLAKEKGVPVYMNEAEADFLANPRLNSSAAFGIPMRQDVQPQFVHEGHNDIGGFDVEAFFLPGHSAGSTVYKIGDALFTGDVLFQGSVGRTDLATGSWQEMMNSIRRLKSFPDALKVYPGHGPASTIGQEKRWNPYFRQS